MDPVTAIAQMITALCNAYVATLAATPEADRKALMDWYVADQTRIRAFFKIN